MMGTVDDAVCGTEVDATGGNLVEVKCPTVKSGRYISIWSQKPIVVCEVEAFSMAISRNILLNRPTTSSPPLGGKLGFPSWKAVDGDLKTCYFSNFEQKMAKPFIKVDL